MTKKKIIEDVLKHAAVRRDTETQKWVSQFYYGQNWLLNGYCVYKDIKMPNMELESTLSEDVISKADYLFSDYTLRDLSDAITIDKTILKNWIKAHRRNEPEGVPFIIGLKKETEIRYICINAWYLRNQFEYLKDNRIFILPDRFSEHSGHLIYNGGVYSFSDDFITTMCMTLPVMWLKDVKADYIVEVAA